MSVPRRDAGTGAWEWEVGRLPIGLFVLVTIGSSIALIWMRQRGILCEVRPSGMTGEAMFYRWIFDTTCSSSTLGPLTSVALATGLPVLLLVLFDPYIVSVAGIPAVGIVTFCWVMWLKVALAWLRRDRIGGLPEHHAPSSGGDVG